MSYDTGTTRGFLLSTREWTAIGGASALMALNVLLMYVLAATPVAGISSVVFAYPIVGVLVYGLLIGGGEMLAERGLENDNVALAVAGGAVLQLAFGTLGAGILAGVSPGVRLTALGVTAVLVVLLTAGIGTYVYARDKDFEHYGTWATYAFVGGLLAVLVGTFLTPVLLLGFVLIFLGFLFRLGWEMWRVREGRAQSAALQAVGLYVAVAGVFVHVLQLVLRYLQRR